ncbi:MAG TPA: D-glycerate dehydrogenase [Solirubrobacteraceae bacterium]|nr:D-glycerate dehydrogenase [Solirubrobacteraceae bacterium]
MARIVVTRTLPGTAVDRLAEHHVVDVWSRDEPPSAGELRALVANADGLLSMLSDAVDEQLIAAAPNLRAIANYAVGSDNIDLAAAAARGIPVGVTPDVLTDATADLAMTLVLAVARHLPEAAASVRNGGWRTWSPHGWLGLELARAELLVIGAGRIGRAVGHRAEAFGMTVVYAGRDDNVAALLPSADVVSLHAPLTQQTRRMIDATALAAMKPGAILINTGRGGLVDQDALRRALHEGHLGGAGLDVTDPEPLPPDDPLLGAPNLIVLPHIGSATHAARIAMAQIAADNLTAALAGEPMPNPAPTRARADG